MASNSTKSFLADAGYGEQELDTNSALMELDKGLRSGKLGEQCEAVVCFPRFFQKYPFPILINSAFLKLADVFRVGNNFLRLSHYGHKKEARQENPGQKSTISLNAAILALGTNNLDVQSRDLI
uniref:Integrator complex subunit 7 N-terminal domain-containing protein n=1 Tax=Callithrix jacchus TaxID=9483 RepID=A0A8I3WFM3_CALJA